MEEQSVHAAEYRKGKFLVSADRDKLNFDTIYNFLSESYWAKGIPREVVVRSIQNSLCFGVFSGMEQVGFARVITDCATYAYLADVFIIEPHRGKGLAKWLMECIVSHPQLQGLRRWTLATRDAHELYAKFGFKPLARPDNFMELHNAEIYKAPVKNLIYPD